jgi:diaminopimelate epimerase
MPQISFLFLNQGDLMKLLIVLSLLMANLAFAAPVEEAQGKLVIQAVLDSLSVHDLDCLTVKNVKRKASDLNWGSIRSLYKVDVNSYGIQPLITASYVETGRSEYVVQFTTNKEETQVTRIVYQSHALRKSNVNVGTLSNPKYEEVETRTLVESVTCK